jgi:hypothetical protein
MGGGNPLFRYGGQAVFKCAKISRLKEGDKGDFSIKGQEVWKGEGRVPV